MSVFKTMCIVLLVTSGGYIGIGMAFRRDPKIIGIDLGMPYSSVGVYRDGKVEIIENEQGNRMTPSCVSITDTEVFIGEAAMNQSHLNPGRTICDFKLLMGKKFDDPEVQKLHSVSRYKIIDKDGKPYIEVKRNGDIVVYSPEEIAAMVVLSMKEMAEAYLGEKLKELVVNVPAYYNSYKRGKAITDACETVGIYTRLVPEPIVASFAYGLDKQMDTNILVVNLGTRMSEVSVLINEDMDTLILSTISDVNLGGQDFDHRLVDHFVKLILKKHEKDISQDKEALGKLLRECERARVELSRGQSYAHVEVKLPFDGIDFSEPLTSRTFEELNRDLLKRVLVMLTKALEGASLKRPDIHEIVFVGGGTRIPMLKQLVKDFFFGKKPLDATNPDEVLVNGASILGAIINGEFYEEKDLLLYAVTPLSLGIETVGGVMTKLIPRDTITPHLKSIILTTYHDQQTSLSIKVYDGERALAKDCREIGSFNVSGITPAPRGVPQIEVKLRDDGDGQVHVTAVDKASGKSKLVTFTNQWCDGKIRRCLIKEAEKFEEDDAKVIARIEARRKLERVFNVKSWTKGSDTDVFSSDKENVKKAVEDVLEWLDELDNKVRNWEDLLSPVMKKSCYDLRSVDPDDVYWESRHDEL